MTPGKFAFIKEHRVHGPIVVMCRALTVGRSGFFAWAKRLPSATSQRRAQRIAPVRQGQQAHRGVYGRPRVHQVLRAQGLTICVNSVARLMRWAGMADKIKRKFVPRTADSGPHQLPAPNLLQRNFPPRPTRPALGQ